MPARGYRPITRVADGPAKGAKVVYLRDQDGLAIEFIEWPAGQS
ncbi:MAG: VOC family protein [Planctomycetota bacterium]